MYHLLKSYALCSCRCWLPHEEGVIAAFIVPMMAIIIVSSLSTCVCVCVCVRTCVCAYMCTVYTCMDITEKNMSCTCTLSHHHCRSTACSLGWPCTVCTSSRRDRPSEVMRTMPTSKLECECGLWAFLVFGVVASTSTHVHIFHITDNLTYIST